MKIKIKELRSVIRSAVLEAKITKTIENPINEDAQMQKMFMGLFERYKSMLVNNILAQSPGKFRAEEPQQGVRTEKGVEAGQYDPEFVKRVSELVDDKVDLLFGPIAKTLMNNWKQIAADVALELGTKAKPKATQQAPQASAVS
jgi:hypothetical protein